MNACKVFLWMVWKDIRIEFRARQFVISTLAFGVLLLVVMGIALNAASRLPTDWSAGLLWMMLFFATSISMNRHDLKERELGGWLGMLLAPVDRSVIFYAKWVSTCLFVLVSQVTLVLAYFVILNQPMPQLPGVLAWVLVGGAVGLTGIGSFLATLAAQSSMRDMLVPMLLFPLTIPLLIALIRLTVFAFEPLGAHPQIWVEVLIGYIAAFALLPWLLYEPLMEV
ncbi:heme exporter protein CcmB [Alicyclobacillus cycloheptanicus]|jgi:heme exporter protein CcmB|uniref:Heme exporter protein CcmB n=1 Tax=Alicyclobacillus cycloheptanicus TaxID=1457 RepID=A0ABT9XDN2_9BACL|nr:heme exporter protein CcmB [Alicyclobacillus cycloheptanicus]MDQ0188397.1 heme exporter protein CcmB [Alicyclobacillus cycloheptanicus]WDM01103.1 heme exporter protein CcmB [Alicyclobacillus cycloheptanicus]